MLAMFPICWLRCRWPRRAQAASSCFIISIEGSFIIIKIEMPYLMVPPPPLPRMATGVVDVRRNSSLIPNSKICNSTNCFLPFVNFAFCHVLWLCNMSSLSSSSYPGNHLPTHLVAWVPPSLEWVMTLAAPSVDNWAQIKTNASRRQLPTLQSPLCTSPHGTQAILPQLCNQYRNLQGNWNHSQSRLD